MAKKYDVIVIGSGIAGINAALQAARSGVFAAGAVRSGYAGMLADATAEGIAAANAAQALLRGCPRVPARPCHPQVTIPGEPK